MVRKQSVLRQRVGMLALKKLLRVEQELVLQQGDDRRVGSAWAGCMGRGFRADLGVPTFPVSECVCGPVPAVLFEQVKAVFEPSFA